MTFSLNNNKFLSHHHSSSVSQGVTTVCSSLWHQSPLGFLVTHQSVEWFSRCISFLSLQSWCPNSHSHWDCSGSDEQNPLCFPSLSVSAVFDSLSLLDYRWEIALPPFIFTFISVCEKSGEQTEARALLRCVKTINSLLLICRVHHGTEKRSSRYDPAGLCTDTVNLSRHEVILFISE